MEKEWTRWMVFLRPAFSRKATFVWFGVVFLGFLARNDTFGVSSIVRALSLPAQDYLKLLHFFHSTAWGVEGLMGRWWDGLANKEVGFHLRNRMVLLGDHTKTPKDGRKMPAVATLHQDSETASKPSFFRGHHWGCICLLVRACGKWFALPLWAKIHEGEAIGKGYSRLPKTIRIVQMAQRIAREMKRPAYLVLDAYFAAGSVFHAAAQEKDNGENQVHILTRAKKNVIAYSPAPPPKKKKRGPKKKYGRKRKLMNLFDSRDKTFVFQKAEAQVYGRRETFRYLVLDWLWKPVKGKLRFILLETSRGRIILMTSDLNLDPVDALELFCHRVSIETMFGTLKNTLGGMGYHFWSRYLKPAPRRPKKNQPKTQPSTNPKATRNTFNAIEKFVNIQLIVLGILQLFAKDYPKEIQVKANCWLRTVSSNTPSEFVTRIGLIKVLKIYLAGYAKDGIMRLIQRKENLKRKKRA